MLFEKLQDELISLKREIMETILTQNNGWNLSRGFRELSLDDIELVYECQDHDFLEKEIEREKLVLSTLNK